MTITVTATRRGSSTQKPLQSFVRGQVVTSAAGSIESLHVLHGLGRSPDSVIPVLRSVISTASTGTPALAAVSWDATQVTLTQQLAAGAVLTRASYDILIEKVYSVVK